MYLEREESLLCKIYVSLDTCIILSLQTCYYTELKQNNQVLEKNVFATIKLLKQIILYI